MSKRRGMFIWVLVSAVTVTSGAIAFCDFQVYDSDSLSFGNPLGGLISFGIQMGLHRYGESRDPTNAEMLVMGTEIRYWFKYALGDGYYRKVVPPVHQALDRMRFAEGWIPERGCIR